MINKIDFLAKLKVKMVFGPMWACFLFAWRAYFRWARVWSVLFCLFLFPEVASLVSFIVIECTYDTLSNYLQLCSSGPYIFT